MSSLHLIRSLRHALAELRDAGEEDDTNQIARALIAELAALLKEDAARAVDGADGVTPESPSHAGRAARLVGEGLAHDVGMACVA